MGVCWALLVLIVAMVLGGVGLFRTGFSEAGIILYGLLKLLLFCFILLSVLSFIRWLWRAYANLNRAGQPTQYASAWAVGAWLVPFLNFVRPYCIVRETWRSTYLLADERVPSLALLRWWWGFFLIDSVIRQLLTLLTNAPESGHQIADAVTSDLVSMLFLLPSTLLTLMVIRRLHAAETRLLALAEAPHDSALPVV